MTTFVSELRPFSLDSETPIYRIRPPTPEAVSLDDPAVKVMTDLRRVKVLTITLDSSIDFALQMMVHAEVRLLVVTDRTQKLLGLITARDIMGERPINIVTKDRVPREQIEVRQIMTPRADIEPLDMRDVEQARVRDVVLLLRDAARQHAPVIDRKAASDRCVLCGIFSSTQIGSQLGVEIAPGGAVQSFAELEQMLSIS